MLHHLFHLGVSPAEKAVRTAAVYLGILLLLRVAGKRTAASLNSFDLVVLLLLSNVVQNAIIGDDVSLFGGLLGAVILIAVNYALVHFAFMSPRFGKAIQGGSTVVVKDGNVDEDELRKLAITTEEFVAGLRRQGLELADTELVTLEPEGVFNAQPKPKPTIEDVMRKLDEIEGKLAQPRA